MIEPHSWHAGASVDVSNANGSGPPGPGGARHGLLGHGHGRLRAACPSR